MKTLPVAELVSGSPATEEIARVLAQGGLVCIPCGGTYRLVCDVREPKAVMRLLQTKRRTGYAPSLLFVPNREGLHEVARDVPPRVDRLAEKYWPGPLTVLVEPSDEIPRKVVKQLAKKTKRVGVRVPGDAHARAVVEAFGGALLVSSANREHKAGANSGAHVRRSFGKYVDIFVDAGELGDTPTSTIVACEDDELTVRREGAVPAEEIQQLAG